MSTISNSNYSLFPFIKLRRLRIFSKQRRDGNCRRDQLYLPQSVIKQHYHYLKGRLFEKRGWRSRAVSQFLKSIYIRLADCEDQCSPLIIRKSFRRLRVLLGESRIPPQGPFLHHCEMRFFSESGLDITYLFPL